MARQTKGSLPCDERTKGDKKKFVMMTDPDRKFYTTKAQRMANLIEERMRKYNERIRKNEHTNGGNE